MVERYPCRSIVLRKTTGPGRAVAAEVAALCHLPSADRPQVCSERIILRAGPEALDLLPGAVRPLLEANLPFVLWWTDDPRPDERLFRDLAAECSRLILDLPDPGTGPEALRLGLDPSINPFARDTAWFGITRWREMVAQFFDGPDPAQALGKIASVEVRAEVPRPRGRPPGRRLAGRLARRPARLDAGPAPGCRAGPARSDLRRPLGRGCRRHPGRRLGRRRRLANPRRHADDPGPGRAGHPIT